MVDLNRMGGRDRSFINQINIYVIMDNDFSTSNNNGTIYGNFNRNITSDNSTYIETQADFLSACSRGKKATLGLF